MIKPIPVQRSPVIERTPAILHNGYSRALYLSNGDIILSGPRTFDPGHHSDARHKTVELWVLGRKLDKPPVRQSGLIAGVGLGIFVLDLEAAGLR